MGACSCGLPPVTFLPLSSLLAGVVDGLTMCAHCDQPCHRRSCRRCPDRGRLLRGLEGVPS